MCNRRSSKFLQRKFHVIMYSSSLGPKALKWWPYALFNFGTLSKAFLHFKKKLNSFIAWKWHRESTLYQDLQIYFYLQSFFEKWKKKSPYFRILHIHERSFNAEYFILLAFSSLINENCFLPAVSSAFNCGPVLIQCFCFNLHVMSSF